MPSHSIDGRRDFLRDAFAGFSTLALAALLRDDRLRAAPADPLAAKPPHRPAKAKSVVFLFMAGGPSQVDTFDPKPLLNKLHGQPRPASFGDAKYQTIQKDAKLLGTARTFTRHGRSGIEVSDLFPHTAKCVDDIAVVRSCHCDKVVHSAAQYELFSGRVVPGFPSMGSWVVYGLGSESRSLPAYVVLPDPNGALEAGQPMYSNGFLPATYQPTTLGGGSRPIRNLDLPPGVTPAQRAATGELVRDLNVLNGTDDDDLAARIRSYDLAFRMQAEAPELFDLSRESKETLALYGIGSEPTDDYGRRCLLARRMVEKGVRFVVVVSGGGPADQQWDAHRDVEQNHRHMAGKTDRPVAGFLTDLKRRGLLDTTLVLWGGEFGRSPEAQDGKGRDHHNIGYSLWLTGGGVKSGRVVGATDDIGFQAVEDPHHVRDVHTTILHQLGLDQDKLTFPHLGRRERLTLVEGKVIGQIV